jgi:general stress protein 26
MQSHHDEINHAWKLANHMKTCMLMTWDGQQQNARPMASHPYQDRNAIYFLTSADSPKERELHKFPAITLIYMDTIGNKYLKFTGHASSDDNRALIKELWSPFAKAWWDSPDDPNIRVITFTPESAELWDSPNAVVATVIMLANAAGAKLPVGEAAKVRMA